MYVVNYLIAYRFAGNSVGSRVEYDSIKSKDNKIEMSVDVKTSASDGVIFFVQQPGGRDIMAVYVKDTNVCILCLQNIHYYYLNVTKTVFVSASYQ